MSCHPDLDKMKVPHDGIVSVTRLAAVCGVPCRQARRWLKDNGLRYELRKGFPYVNLIDALAWGHGRSPWLRSEIGSRGTLRLALYISRYIAQEDQR